MAIKQLANGRYKVTVEAAGNGRGPDRKRRTRTVDTRAEAEAKEAQLRRLTAANAHGRTVLDVVDRYLDLYGADLEPGTENTYRSTRDVYIAPTWLGRLELDEVDADELERFYAEVAAGRHSPARRPGKKSRSTVRKVHRLLSVSFGAHRRWISPNPCLEARVRVGTKQAPSAADEYDLADVARTLDAAGETGKANGETAARIIELGVELAELVQFTLATGARAAEVAGLRWRDVELSTGVVGFAGSVTKKRRADGPGWARKSTKTGKPRKLRVDAACIAMLEARYARQIEQATEAGLDADDLERRAVWSLELERDYTSPAALGARWRRARDKVDEVGLTFHDLRHVNASEMSNAGVPVQAAIARTGHASARMYHDVYGHHRAETDDVAVDALGVTWSNVEAKRKAPARRKVSSS